MKLLKHRDEMVRRKAIESIYKIGAPPKELVPALSPMLNDPSADVCITAASVLGKIGPSAKEAVPALLAGAGGIDSRLSWHGGVALLEIDPESAKKAIPAIVLALRIGNDEAIRETLRLLPTLGPEAKLIIPDMVELLSTVHDADARQTAITALARIGIAAENALPSVLRVLDDPDPIIRARAAECVGHIGATAKEATPKLQRLLTDDDESVRKAASEALKAIAPESEKR
jgi:HEAT repeat protein